jgi:hypothetical protein
MATTPGLRLKTFWFKDERPREPGQVATATAAVVWRSANHRIQNLRRARFRVEAGADYANVLVELLCLAVVIADRAVARLVADDGAWRQAFTPALAVRAGELLEDSLNDLIGPDPDAARGWRRRFVDRFNLRNAEYAQYDDGPEGPSFGLLRHFGEVLTEAMADDDDRRWATDQAMTVEGPELADVLEKTMRELLGHAPKPARRRESGD